MKSTGRRRSTPGPRWPSVVAGALVCAAPLAFPGAAPAAPLGDPSVYRVTAEHPIVAGVPVRIHLQGTAAGTAPADPGADTDPAAGLAVLPPGVSCPGSYAEVAGATYQDVARWTRGDPASEPFDVAPAITFDNPGTYTGCGYFGLEGFQTIDEDPTATTIQFQPRPLVVARPTVAMDLAFDGPPTSGGTVRLVGSASSDAPETVTIHLNRAADACGGTAEINAARNRFTTSPEPFELYGGPRPIRVAVGLPAEGGDFRLCTYASRAGQSGDPDLAVRGASVTIPAPPPAPPVAPPADPNIGSSAPPVQVVPPVAAPVDTTTLTPTVPTKPALACRLATVAVPRGRSVQIRCPNARGTIGVRLRKVGGPRTTLRTSTLRLHLSRAVLRTSRLTPGTWTTTVLYHGKPAGTISLRVLTPTSSRKKASR